MDAAELTAAFLWHAQNCSELGSVFVARVCELFADHLQGEAEFATLLAQRAETVAAPVRAVPLQVAGALHALVLEGRSEELTAVFPPRAAATSDEGLWRAIHTAMSEHRDFILQRLEQAPQTNEVRRAAILLPAFLTIAALTKFPLILSELGASAGLNLYFDRFAYRLGETEWGDQNSSVQLAPVWIGPEPPSVELEIVERAGCDVSPLDPSNPSDRVRLLSYIWADQSDRIAECKAALEIAQREPLSIAGADARDWVHARLGSMHVGATHVIFHTILWPYLSAESQKAIESAIRTAGEEASMRSPLAWLRFEPDDEDRGGAVTLTLWPNGNERRIARADFHGQWIDWTGW